MYGVPKTKVDVKSYLSPLSVDYSLKISASGQTCGQRRKMGLFNPESREEQAH